MWRKLQAMKTRYLVTFTILIATGVVAFWRGAWQLMDHFLFPKDPVLSAVVSLVAGTLILVGTETITHKI